MGVSGPYEVDPRRQFPFGLGLLSEVSAVLEFDRKKAVKDRRQERDKVTGLPLWSADLLDFDPEARERTFKVKFAAAVRPVPPAEVEGAQIRPVQLEGVRITCFPKVTGRDEDGNDIVKVGQSVTASGFAAPGKPAGDAAKAGER
jgi:hypothetical protein